MDIKKLQRTCEQLTKSLTPARVEVLEPTETSFTLRVVSNHFQGMSLLSRSDLLSNLIEGQAQELVAQYLFDFEVWTEAEFASLGDSGDSSEAKPSSASRRIAARSIDL